MKDFLILVVEDDRSIQNLIGTTLKINHYTYLSAVRGEDAVSLSASHNPGLILLDLGLPDMDGIEVIRTIRTWSQVPIIVISARGEDSDKIEALDTGADDYLTKPFSVDEMLARIRAVQRRLQYAADNTPSPLFVNGSLTVDFASGVSSLNGKELHLTPIEYKLLCLLSRNVGKVLTHSFIIRQVWGKEVESDIISLRVYMASLRKKLSGGTEENPLIQTHVGIGYQMVKL